MEIPDNRCAISGMTFCSTTPVTPENAQHLSGAGITLVNHDFRNFSFAPKQCNMRAIPG
jgi:hypothetical protein